MVRTMCRGNITLCEQEVGDVDGHMTVLLCACVSVFVDIRQEQKKKPVASDFAAAVCKLIQT